MSTALTVREAGLLGQVLVARLAVDTGIRALAIKGPTLAVQGLRGDRVSADVDVLVDPREQDRFVEAMADVGWARGTATTAPSIMPRHSVTIRHSSWPIEIDVHDRFPGFLAPPQDTFESLWARNVTVQVAGQEVTTCDVVGHAALAALHYLREPGNEAHRRALDQLVAAVSRQWGHHELAELSWLAAETGSGPTLEPFLMNVGAPSPPTTTRGEEFFEEWDLRVNTTGSVPWVLQLTETPLHRWPRTIWHAIWLSDEEIDEFHAGRGGSSRLARRLHRLWRGARQLPAAVTDLVRVRRRQRRGVNKAGEGP